MTVKELILLLKEYPEDLDIIVSNGFGDPTVADEVFLVLKPPDEISIFDLNGVYIR